LTPPPASATGAVATVRTNLRPATNLPLIIKPAPPVAAPAPPVLPEKQ